MEGYDFTAADFPLLLVRKFYPEKTDRETPIIRDWLLNNMHRYDRISFSVRAGEGQTPAPDLLPGVARSVERSTKKRIDVLAWTGQQPTVVEVKERITAAALGQLLMYRDLVIQELPNVLDPALVAIGRYSDPETIRSLNAYGVDVLLYDNPASG